MKILFSRERLEVAASPGGGDTVSGVDRWLFCGLQ